MFINLNSLNRGIEKTPTHILVINKKPESALESMSCYFLLAESTNGASLIASTAAVAVHPVNG